MANFHACLYSVLVAGDLWSSNLNRRISRAFPIRVLASSLIGSFFAILQLNITKTALVVAIPNIAEKFGAIIGFLFALGGQYKTIVTIYRGNPQVLEDFQHVLLSAIEIGFVVSIILLFLTQARCLHFILLARLLYCRHSNV